MSEMDRELKQYHDCMDRLRAPEALTQEVWNMTIHSQAQVSGAGYDRREAKRFTPSYRVPIIRNRLLPLAAAVILLLAVGMGTYAAKPSLFGWGGNFEVRDTGHGTESVLHTDSLVDPVEVEDGRLWFIVNGEHIDITDEISETEPFLYQYTDESGVIHYWLVGKNGPELWNWGYGEYLYKPEENWMAGYSARTNLGPGTEGPAWLENGRNQINFYR